MPWRESLCPRLTEPLCSLVRALNEHTAAQVSEIRLFCGAEAYICLGRQRMHTGICMDRHALDEQIAALTGYSVFSCESQMAKGYIPLAGGHRAGVCGAMRCETGGLWRMADVTSVCIRICRQVPGASSSLRPELLDRYQRPRSVLVFGAPGSGKTTVLRDAALWLSGEAGLRVSVIDEREELFADVSAQHGVQLDVLSGMDRTLAIPLVLRSMAPDVLITDELGSREDARVLQDAARCGVSVLASAHAGSIDDLFRRPSLCALAGTRVFERYVQLGMQGRVSGVWDGEGENIRSKEA